MLTDYTKTTWADGDNRYDIKTQASAVVSADIKLVYVGTAAGTAISQTVMNNIEDQVELITTNLLTASTDGDTVTTEITSLASTVLKSKLVTEVNGRSRINVLSDDVAGCEANTGWTASSGSIATDNSNELEGTNCLKATLGAASDTYDYDVFALLDATKYYFLSGYVKNGNATNITLSLETDDEDVSASAVTATTYTRVGVVIQPTNIDTASSAVIRLTVTGSAGQYAYFDALMLQEISSADYALGATALLSKYAYHRGLKHSDKMRILSVWKNLFNYLSKAYTIPEADFSGRVVENGWYIKGTTTSDRIYWDIYLEPNSTYYIDRDISIIQSGTDSENGKVVIYSPLTNTNLKIIYKADAGGGSFTSPSDGHVQLALLATAGTAETAEFEITNIQLEKGSTATSYEPYTETSAILPTELKSVSDSICDTWDANSGLHTQNVESDEDISSTQYDSIDTATYTNVDVVKTTAFSSMRTPTTSADGTTKVINSSNMILTEVSQANIDLTASVGKYYTHTDKTVWFIVANGAYADIAAARTGLGTSQIIYQLATPVPTQFLPNTLTAESSGTIIVEPFVEETNEYAGGITIDDSNYPVANLSYVYAINSDGTETPIALSSCTVAAGGGSFTITNGSGYYRYGYTYNFLSSIPSLTYTHADSSKKAIDGAYEQTKELDDKIEQLNAKADINYDDIVNNKLKNLRNETINIAMGGWRLG